MPHSEVRLLNVSSKSGARILGRVGAGVVGMMGGDACVALVPSIKLAFLRHQYADACVALVPYYLL